MPKRKRELLSPSCNPSRSPNVRLKPRGEEDPVCIWVQCENERCHKWRQISAEEAKGLEDSSWYCWLNRDTRYNTCSAQEQKAKKPKHMKFIYSLLPEGEVVMAKMHGYPSWPGLLTRDPTCGEYYDAPLVKEDEVTHYHVEFFGLPRSRAWLIPSLVHPLRSMNEIEKAPKFRKIQGRQLIELKKSYEFALGEAYSSLKKTTDQRLESCHFKYVEEEDKPATPKASTEQAPAVRVQETKIPERRNSATSPLNSPTIPIMMKKPWISHTGSVSPSDWKEKEFLERLESFSLERGVTLPKQPIWRGKRISFSRFYNLVLKHGGFENVCQCKLWNKVYNELLDSGVVYGGTSSAARVFYQKYLMPFEHHLETKKGIDIQFVPEDVSSPPAKQPGRRPSINRRRTVSSTLADEGEQKVPETQCPNSYNVITRATEQHNKIFDNNGESDDGSTSYALSSDSVTSSDSSEEGEPNEETLATSSSQGERRTERSGSSAAKSTSRTKKVFSTGALQNRETDQVPSSNPDSPHQSFSGCSFDSDESDDESTTSTCDEAEKELQQLERLLLSLEPSLYPQTEGDKLKSRAQQEEKSLPRTQSINATDKEVDVLKTLDEIARIEGAIADLSSLVSLEMEQL